jgi:hypothetical protein
MVLGFVSIDLFSRHHVLTSERRAQVQNEVSYVLEHMAKHICQGIGSLNSPGVITSPAQPQEWIKIRWDRNFNGQPDDDGANDWISYRYLSAQDQIAYYATYPFNGWPAGGEEIISRKITNCSFSYNLTDNFVDVIITGCYDPDGTPFACGTSDNPTVTMRTRIKMPSVSTN